MTCLLQAITQRRTDAATALQALQRGLKAAESAVSELEIQRQQVDKDLKSLVKQVPELSSMLARQVLNVVIIGCSNGPYIPALQVP